MTASNDAPLAEVHLLRVPVDLWAQSQEHVEELLREFTLIAQDTEHTHDIPHRLLELVEALTADYAASTTEQERALNAAVDAGETEIADLVYLVPPQAADAARALDAMLDESDTYCREGQHLLTLATPEELVRLRRWWLDQFDRQIAGEPATAWPDWRG